MSKWPVVTPEKDRSTLHVNLTSEPPPDPATFDGPLNLFIALHTIAQANNIATTTKNNYDTLHPPAPLIEK